MDFVTATSITFLVVALFVLLSRAIFKTGRNNLPPGPHGWPIIGNILDLGTIPHQTFYKLRFIYGPIIWLKLGSVNTMVVQSAAVASELFKNYDLPFCDRKCPGAFTALGYNQGSMVFGKYGAYWRVIRRLYSMELIVNTRLKEAALVLQKCVDDMIRFIEEDGEAARQRGETGELNIPHFLFVMGFNLIGNIVLSRDLLGSKSREGIEFSDAMDKVMALAGKPNLGDYFPVMKWLDVQGMQRNAEREMGRALEIVKGFVRERKEDMKMGKVREKKDFLDVLMEYDGVGREGPDKISDHNITITVLEAFFAGSETSSSTMEWTMTELLRNLDIMKKAKDELQRVVGPNRKVEESDIDNLSYLQAIVKETLRLHPAAPLLIPRNERQDTKFMGYLILKDTQILVNVWAIGRDPESWNDPTCFNPDRFLGSNIDYKGRNFEFLPFGSGRRICAGIGIAHRVVHLGLGALIHCFDWELAGDVTPASIDMNERVGLTMRKVVPLTSQSNSAQV